MTCVWKRIWEDVVRRAITAHFCLAFQCPCAVVHLSDRQREYRYQTPGLNHYLLAQS